MSFNYIKLDLDHYPKIMVGKTSTIKPASSASAPHPSPDWTAATTHLRSRIAQACPSQAKMQGLFKYIENSCSCTSPEFRPEKEFIAINDYCNANDLPGLTVDELNGFGITDSVW